ncbi:porin [Granulosicoccus sp. 3-233]|uniref:porin n=1 Tax=Granulosicoccus sp. 3-233 TaxID=3417969 RepID=UPI003D34E712
MKFTKTAVAVAIAGIAAAPMIASADTTLSGVVEIALQGTDIDDDDLEIGTGDVLFGITSEHEMDSGLTGYGSLRVDLDRLSNQGSVFVENGPGEDDDLNIGSVGTADAVYVGIKGGFGDFRMGEIPLAVEYGQVANDIYDVGSEISGGMSYTGTFGPVGLVANFSPEGNQDALGLGAKFGIGGFSIGLGGEQRGEDDLVNGAVGVSFAFAGASIAAHFWSQEVAETAGTGDLESASVKIGYGFGGVSAALTVSTLEDDGATDQNAVRLDLGYALGGGTQLSSRITQFNDDNDADAEFLEYRVMLAKSF